MAGNIVDISSTNIEYYIVFITVILCYDKFNISGEFLYTFFYT